MPGACPVPGPDDPLVRGLLGVVDCNVQTVVQTGYASLFQPGGAFVGVLTVLMTLYVALVGYRLLLGRSPLNVTDLALTTVKLGAVLAFATQWGTYQSVVYRTLFFGPEQIADVILHGLRANGSVVGGNVYDGLQRAFTDMTAFSPATPPGTPAVTAPVAAALGANASGSGPIASLLSKAGFDSLLLLGSAVILLLSSLGVLLASKIVLALLLAFGPVFIALLLFETTQGLFQGWLRATLGFAFAPLATTLTLGLALTLLDPSLRQLETMRADSTYLPGVAFAVAVLVMVFAGVSLGLVVAGGAIAAGFKPPRMRGARTTNGAGQTLAVGPAETAAQPRAVRIASAASAQARRDQALFAPSGLVLAGAGAAGGVDRRTTVTTTSDRAAPPQTPVDSRLGQQSRRNASPRLGRSGPRSDAGGGR